VIKNRADQAWRERFLIAKPTISGLIPASWAGEHAKARAVPLDISEVFSQLLDPERVAGLG
jgi:hypothetical protein